MTQPSRADWINTTHDWAGSVDQTHLDAIRADPDRYAPGGLLHLVLEVLAYPDDEAESAGQRGQCSITTYGDGSIAISDNGRGTDTRLDEHGAVVRKPIMATQDLRFFGNPDAPTLPDGHPRCGMSVVAALSEWLVHTNRRANGSWTQRYEHGIPVSDLRPVDPDGTTGTTVHFRPARRDSLPGLAPYLDYPHIEITVREQ
ncbi:ATP-binding protein [Kribbella shirazensis]|uniref:DNA topoisomerase (ATP-hydrolyzing) n=1 Tax=Kribbella shirazensis TaxID=1105143 RepID=A0A7X5V737_9ACTN|nr:ATP-binding protein [Kribbella shirazensis]NIK55840.1 DNA gyrase subunit B [Kribbella shirazensis]